MFGVNVGKYIFIWPIVGANWQNWLKYARTVRWLSQQSEYWDKIILDPSEGIGRKQTYGGFLKWEVPNNGWFNWENPSKMDDLGVPLFQDTSMFETTNQPLHDLNLRMTTVRGCPSSQLFPAQIRTACKVEMYWDYSVPDVHDISLWKANFPSRTWTLGSHSGPPPSSPIGPRDWRGYWATGPSPRRTAAAWASPGRGARRSTRWTRRPLRRRPARWASARYRRPGVTTGGSLEPKRLLGCVKLLRIVKPSNETWSCENVET